MVRRPADMPRRSRGFTLIELMAVVGIVGILAMLATVSYRKYVSSSKTSEAIYMVGAIRAAEESYRAETLRYLSIGWDRFYPMETPTNAKYSWDSGMSSPNRPAWLELGVRPDGPVYFGYKVVAGVGTSTTQFPTLSELATAPTWAPTAAEPWYLIEAKGDVNGNTVPCYVVGSSFTGELYIENAGE